MVVPIGIVVLIGLPAAGKTTFSQKIVKRLSSNSKCHTINYDALIKNHTKDHYKQSRKSVLDSVESLIMGLRSKTAPCKQLIIVDDNMYYRSMRHEYYKLAKSFQLSFLQVFIDIDVNMALIRNARRNTKLPDKVIQDMASKIEVPDSHQNHWERHTCFIRGLNDGAFREFLEALTKSLNDPVCFSETDIRMNVPINRTRLQDVEILLRKLVAENIKSDEKGRYKDDIVLRKKEVFKKIKSGEIYLPIDWDDARILEHLKISF